MSIALDFSWLPHTIESEVTEAIQLFRDMALLIDQSPESIQSYYKEPIFQRLNSEKKITSLERIQWVEALAYGDPGVVLASPGSSLAGFMVRHLGTEEQKASFSRYIKAHCVPTFFAVTEPGCGSDLLQMQTQLSLKNGQWVLKGQKHLIGHGAHAPMGVVIARCYPSALGLGGVLLSAEVIQQAEAEGKLERSDLPMLGLRGARLASLHFKDVPIPESAIVGGATHSVTTVFTALIGVFNHMRPSVAALALGISQAMLDYIAALKILSTEHDCYYKRLRQSVSIGRSQLYQLATSLDAGNVVTSHSSLIKFSLVRLAESIARFMLLLVPRHLLFQHPLLLKWSRDVLGFEYMEGTSYIHAHHITQGYVQDEFHDMLEVA